MLMLLFLLSLGCNLGGSPRDWHNANEGIRERQVEGVPQPQGNVGTDRQMHIMGEEKYSSRRELI